MRFLSRFFDNNSIFYFLFLSIILYLLGIRLLLNFSYNLDLDGAEFTFVHYIQQIMADKQTYMNPYEMPYSITLYAPLYLVVVAITCKVFSLNYIFDIHEIFIVGRLFSFFFSLLGTFYIYKFSKLFLNQIRSLFIVTLYLLLLTGHSYAVRPDSMKIAFFIIYLYYYVDYFFLSKEKKSALLSLVALFISISAKQDVIIYAILIQGVTLLLLKSKDIVIYGVLSFICIVSFFFFTYLISGNAALASLTIFNLQVISDYSSNYNYYVVLFNFVRLFPFLCLFVWCCFKQKNEKIMRLLCVSGLVAFLLSSFCMMRPGSYLNYTYELIVIAIFTFIFYLKNQENISIKNKVIASVYFLFLLLSNAGLKVCTVNFNEENNFKEKYFSYYKMRDEILPLLSSNSIIFNPDLQYSLFLADQHVIYGHEYHLDREIHALLGLPSHSKLLSVSSAPFDELFKNGFVTHVVTQNKKSSDEVMQMYYANYKLIQMHPLYKLYQFNH
ncbi:MAG: hypothetical protein R2739_06570 [Chitinophagales bacterium]|nr:hypothetical protein [Bacteroidota bacterium]